MNFKQSQENRIKIIIFLFLNNNRNNDEDYLPSKDYNLPLMKRKNCINNLCQEETNKKFITFWDFIRKL